MIQPWIFDTWLWERKGSELVNAVLFELPFVALRVLSVMLLIAMGITYGVLGAKAQT